MTSLNHKASRRNHLRRGPVFCWVMVSASLVTWNPAWGAPSHRAVLEPTSAPPGATVAINGRGFGSFTSAHHNFITFNGTPALVQRWDRNRIEVKVPFQATTGPVEIGIGKKRVTAGSFTLVHPRIEHVTPHEAERGATLRITGRHFGPSSGSRDPNTMFGVNDVMIGGAIARPIRWTDDQIEVRIPPSATSGAVVVRLASFDPLPDGSCCQPVRHVTSNAVPVMLVPTIRVDPLAGPIGTKVVLFGEGFGSMNTPEDGVFINGQPAPVAQWRDDVIVAHVPLGAQSGPLVLRTQGRTRSIADFTVHVPKVTSLSPSQAPIGTLLTIRGEHFGMYSESGRTPYSFADFDTGDNRVEIGGVRAVTYRWHDDRIDVWVPFSAKSGPVTIYRGAKRLNPDGSCCTERQTLATAAGEFTLVTPTIHSYTPQSAGLDERVTISGSGFGTFLKGAEHAHLAINQKAYKRREDVEINDAQVQGTVLSDVSRTEVLFNGTAALVESWTDSEIVVRVPHRNLYGIGKRGAFYDNLASGPLVVRRGSWDVLPDGTCCTPKQWLTLEAGPFTIEAKNLPDTGYFTGNRVDANTSQ